MSPCRRRAWFAPAVVLVLAGCSPSAHGDAPPLTPQEAVDQFLAADRAFSAASSDTELVAGLTAMLAADVAMPMPGGVFAQGVAAVAEALRSSPDNAGARAEWAPVRGGISADGLHGFTFGFMTVRKADGSTTALKYLAYWVKGTDGWRVVAYKRRPRPAGEVSLVPMAPSLPAAMVAPGDSQATAQFRESLSQAERDFSADAQRIGLGPAFAQYGSADAMNLGGPADTNFVIGAEAIARLVAVGQPPAGSSVSWGPDRTIVASSGDLGVTIGVIRANTPAADGSTPSYAFFTIWRRATPADPWRYIAE